MTPACWMVDHGIVAPGACIGRIVQAHLIPKQRIKREYPRGAFRYVGQKWQPIGREGAPVGAVETISQKAIVWDPRVVVPMCGGPTGAQGHHGMLDWSRTIKIPRAVLPLGLEEYAVDFGLEWSLERDYGRKV